MVRNGDSRGEQAKYNQGKNTVGLAPRLSHLLYKQAVAMGVMVQFALVRFCRIDIRIGTEHYAMPDFFFAGRSDKSVIPHFS